MYRKTGNLRGILLCTSVGSKNGWSEVCTECTAKPGISEVYYCVPVWEVRTVGRRFVQSGPQNRESQM